MTLNEFVSQITKSIDAQGIAFVLEACKDFSEEELDLLLFDFYTQKFKNISSLLELVKQKIHFKAKELAQAHSIKKFSGTRLEEEKILYEFFLSKELKNKPQWLQSKLKEE